jgi:hypothetical protein
MLPGDLLDRTFRILGEQALRTVELLAAPGPHYHAAQPASLHFDQS